MLIGPKVLYSVENDLFIFDLFMLMLKELENSLVQPYRRVKNNFNSKQLQNGCLGIIPEDYDTYISVFIFMNNQ